MTRYADAQNLREKFGAGTFDIAHAQNSLDLTSDPIGALEEMFRVTKPGGFVVLLHAENEGRNQCYWALHKWDFTCGNGRFIIKGPGSGGPRCDVTELFSGRADVECTLDDGAVLVAIRKRAV